LDRNFRYGLSLEPIQTRNLRDYNTTTTTSPNLKRVDFSTSFRYLSGPKKCMASTMRAQVPEARCKAYVFNRLGPHLSHHNPRVGGSSPLRRSPRTNFAVQASSAILQTPSEQRFPAGLVCARKTISVWCYLKCYLKRLRRAFLRSSRHCDRHRTSG